VLVAASGESGKPVGVTIAGPGGEAGAPDAVISGGGTGATVGATVGSMRSIDCGGAHDMTKAATANKPLKRTEFPRAADRIGPADIGTALRQLKQRCRYMRGLARQARRLDRRGLVTPDRAAAHPDDVEDLLLLGLVLEPHGRHRDGGNPVGDLAVGGIRHEDLVRGGGAAQT
jgi:hypothetical protein